MTEPNSQSQPERTDEESHASVGEDPARPGGGRTSGETSVDEAMGQEPGEPS